MSLAIFLASVSQAQVSASLPTWVSALSVGQWYAIPNTALSSVDPSPIPPGVEGPSAKVDDWTSFVVDHRSSKLYTVANGGHAGYGGNEVDVLTLDTASPAWSQVLAPTPNAQVTECTNYYTDGKPTSRHTYYGITLDEFNDRIMLFAGAWYCGGGGFFKAVSSYKIAANAYNASGTHPDMDHNGAYAAVMDPFTGNVYHQDFSTWRYSSSANTIDLLTTTGTDPVGGDGCCGAFDTTRGRAFYLGENNDRHYYTLSTNTWTTVTLTGANAADVTNIDSMGMFYCPILDRYLVRKDTSGGTVYQINASTFEVTTFSTTGGTSVPATINGPRNKFLYVPQLGGAVYVPQYSTNAWFLRLHAARNVIQVGPGRTYTTLNAVVGVVADGDTVEIDAGTYNNTEGVWTKHNLTFKGIGGKAHLVAPGTITNAKAICVVQGRDTTFDNIEFSGAAVPDANGAGIRQEGANLTVKNCYFHDNENGILGNDTAGVVLIEYTQFANNGAGDGFSHNMYFGVNERVTLRHCYSHHANSGHLFKSRAKENFVLYNRLMDESTGNASYQINLPNGGLSYIIGNVVQKGSLSENSGAMVTYGEDGLTNASKQLYVVNNTFVNDLGANLVTFIQVQTGADSAQIKNNLFVEMDTIATGPNTQTTNQQTTTPNLVNRAGFDYRPTSNTPGINGGTAPGIGNAYNLTPLYQYVHTASREDRPVSGTIDIGAFEYVP